MENQSKRPLIALRQVVKRYEGISGSVTALNEVNLEVYAGEFLVVTGKSGAGKTTLVNVLTGLDRCTTGEIWVDGTAVHRLGAERAARWRGQAVGVVFQSFELLPTLDVWQNVTLAMDFAGRYTLRRRKVRAMTLLEQFGIAEHAHKPPSGLSGGQQQRAAIARALANDPPLLVADEPTGSLDSATAETVLRAFERLVAQGKTVVLVTHDNDIAQRGTRTIQLEDGKMVGEL